MEKILIILFSSISFIAVFCAIVFDGRIKVKENEKKQRIFKEFKREFKLLTSFAKILIIIGFIVNILNAFFSIKSINDNENKVKDEKIKYKNDSTNLMNLLLLSKYLNTVLNEKKINDSIEIDSLLKLTKLNGLKSDLIKKSVVDNAVKAMDEQRERIEKEKENTYKQFQTEVIQNLLKIENNFEKNHILGFTKDTLYFINTRLDNTYINKYKLISNNSDIIMLLTIISESVDKINDHIESIIFLRSKIVEKSKIMRMLLLCIDNVKFNLYSCYSNEYNLKSYRDFEKLDFTKIEMLNIDSARKLFSKQLERY
jgi:hypothetical protein